MEEIFFMLGKVEKVVVLMEKDGGYGFVTFQDYMVLRKVEQEEITVRGCCCVLLRQWGWFL